MWYRVGGFNLKPVTNNENESKIPKRCPICKNKAFHPSHLLRLGVAIIAIRNQWCGNKNKPGHGNDNMFVCHFYGGMGMTEGTIL